MMNQKIEFTNYFFRFVFEIIAWISLGIWGWKNIESPLNYLSALGLPIIFAILWGVFNVPGDPSRSGKAPVKVPGLIRLLIELSLFGFASWALYDLGYKTFSIIFVVLLIIHYLISYERVKWILKQK